MIDSPSSTRKLRAATFIDGQNLFRCAKRAFGYYHPNYDPFLLSMWAIGRYGWVPSAIHFYTGVPEAIDDRFWNHIWGAKFAQMGRKGIKLFRRPIKFHTEQEVNPDGTTKEKRVGREKGIDVRIALDLVLQAIRNEFDAAIIFSQDNDLAEAVLEIKEIAKSQSRTISIVSAFPEGSGHPGIAGTEWLKISKSEYDACLDLRDYRPKS